MLPVWALETEKIHTEITEEPSMPDTRYKGMVSWAWSARECNEYKRI